MNALLSLVSEQQVAAYMLVLGRVSPLFLLAPLFSSRMLPARARGVAAVGIAVGMAPLAMPGPPLPLDALGYGGLMLKEVLVGAAFSFVIAALLAAVTAAGSFLDTLSGFAYSALVDPLTGTHTTVLAQFYTLMGVMVFIVIGGDGWVLRGLARTYELVPLRELPSLGTLTAGVQGAFASVFAAALEVAAPVVLALVVTDAAFGMVSRTVPQMNVFAVGFPAKIVVALVIAAASLPFAAGWIAAELERSVGAALETLRVA